MGFTAHGIVHDRLANPQFLTVFMTLTVFAAAKTARREARKVMGSETAATPGAGDGGHVARPASAKGRIPLGAMNRCKDKGGEVGEAGGAGCSKVPRSDLKKGFDQVAGEGT